jgi:hypothetical protein
VIVVGASFDAFFFLASSRSLTAIVTMWAAFGVSHGEVVG